uniref:Xrn1 N-terminal domain-containing protein n=1 Tax=viral metagenome TaxID=1070528 RepID=A0A6C0HH08_9ZZZZ
MGIPSYFSHIVKKHRSIIKKFNQHKDTINNLYLDSNSIIYDAVHELSKEKNINYAQFEDKLILAVCEKLVYYIKLIKPNHTVFIAFDGVAPVAKLNQQRRRRYMGAIPLAVGGGAARAIPTAALALAVGGGAARANPSAALALAVGGEAARANLLPGGWGAAPPWNTSNITPGTSFMLNLGDKVKARFSNPKEFGLENIMVSTADEAGEGEHKLFEYIRNTPAEHKESITVIYGLDADLIMLTLNHLHISEQLYLFRETPHFIKSLDNTLDPNSLYLLDIPLFAKSITGGGSAHLLPLPLPPGCITGGGSAHLLPLPLPPGCITGGGLPLPSSCITGGGSPTDYIFICFLLGNDFMPHFPALNIRTKGIDHLMLAYKHVFTGKNEKNGLTDGDKIIWKNLRKYITYLAGLELEYIQAEYILRDKMASRKPFQSEKDKDKEVDETLLLPMKDRSAELYINPFEAGWRERYYSTLFDIKINDARCKEICINYLEGLEWTMKYYTSGCVDWRWTYKYHYAPLLSDLIKYIPYFDTHLVPVKEKNPVLPIVQLCYVLPKSSHYLLPQKVNALISKSRPEWYSNNCRFQWAFCKYFWESHMDMPEIDIGELEALLDLSRPP